MNIICDLDGTIALDTGRAHHLHGSDCPKRAASGLLEPHRFTCICKPEDRDWKSYFEACDTDKPCLAVIQIINSMYEAGHTIYILSGRSMSVNKKTLDWLGDHGVVWNYLQMRGIDNREDDHILKLKWAVELELTPQNTLFVLEDRTRVVEAWRANGFRCFQVADGNF